MLLARRWGLHYHNAYAKFHQYWLSAFKVETGMDWVDGWTDGWMDTHTHTHACVFTDPINLLFRDIHISLEWLLNKIAVPVCLSVCTHITTEEVLNTSSQNLLLAMLSSEHNSLHEDVLA